MKILKQIKCKFLGHDFGEEMVSMQLLKDRGKKKTIVYIKKCKRCKFSINRIEIIQNKSNSTGV